MIRNFYRMLCQRVNFYRLQRLQRSYQKMVKLALADLHAKQRSGNMRDLQNGKEVQMKLAQCSCGECLRCVREYDMYWNHHSMPKKSNADDAIKKIFEIADKDAKENAEKTKE